MNNDIIKIVHHVRNSLEMLSKTGSAEFKFFPKDCCGIASIVINRVLRKMGYNNFYYIMGKSKIFGVHAWIENENFIIDLTADQFITAGSMCFFYKKGESYFYPDFFHKSFKIILKYSEDEKPLKSDSDLMDSDLMFEKVCEKILKDFKYDVSRRL